MSMIHLLNEDNMQVMARYPDKYFDLAIVDPEYGRKEHGGTERSKWVKQTNGSALFVKDGGYKKKGWDDKPAAPEYFQELQRVSKEQIIWGCNYYPENFGSGRVIWDKCNEGSDQSDCEIAYNSLTERVDLFRYMWRGMMQGKSIEMGWVQQGNKALNEKRIHPTQKPRALYKWLYERYAKPGQKILDTHGGSFNSAIEAHFFGVGEMVICEIDQEYFEAGRHRFLLETNLEYKAQIKLETTGQADLFLKAS